MNAIQKRFILIFIAFILFISANAQSNTECRYLMVLTYLRTNEHISEQIKKVYPKITQKKNKYIDFNLSNRIDFFSISSFSKKLNSKIHGVSEELINNNKLYYDKYYFESYESTFLEKLIYPNNSKLYLTFSKSVDDYLVVEMGNFDPKINRNVKFGVGLKIFFKFDSNGFINDILYSVTAYN